MVLFDITFFCLVTAIFISTIFCVHRTAWNRKRKGKQYVRLYADIDGAADMASQQNYTTMISTSLALLSVFIGFIFCMSEAIVDIKLHQRQAFVLERWATSGAWALLVAQALGLVLEHLPTQRYSLANLSAVSAFMILSFIFGHKLMLAQINTIDDSNLQVVLTLVQISACVVAIFAFLSLQRRPTVYSDGKPVDAELTCSALDRYTFSWATIALRIARYHNHLCLEDLPKISHYMRSNFLLARFPKDVSKNRLWKQVWSSFRWAWMQQLSLAVITSITRFGPQYAMFNLLKILERKHGGTHVMHATMIWVSSLGVCMFFNAVAESWLLWIGWSQIAIPIRAMLSISVFAKSTRRKTSMVVHDIELIPPEEPTPSIEGNDRLECPTGIAAREQSDTEDHEPTQKSQNGTGNLVAVDTRRISDFTSLCWFFPASAVRLIVSLGFVYSLIGWESLLAGMLAWSLTIPLNILVSKRYSSLRGGLMKARDQRLAVITEALQCIRQIKFSAHEGSWLSKIGKERDQELLIQWKAFMYSAGLLCILISGPVLLSTVSLITYACIHRSLLPSIAFTTISIFGQIEFTLAIIPHLVTNAIDAWVSFGRLQGYLEGPDKVQCAVQADCIAFEDVSVAWPSDSQDRHPSTFILRDINLIFPAKELSVISGKTGSGKSLLLAAMLGEVDQLAGLITMPKTPCMSERFDNKATRMDWIIDSAIAYVAQSPWMENATIRDNILFDLPLDQDRYEQTTSVCALTRDLEMFQDGDLTDIGSNGVNLSGGQRWRISFARALYSRAGILVLDDVLSSVDSQVGRQLLEEALAGPLGIGRTRILVTHHVDLCRPRTTYAVVLGNGTVQYAGPMKDLDQRTILDDMRDPALSDKVDDIKAPLDKHDTQENDDLGVVSDPHDAGERDLKEIEAKKFTEHEDRETGSIALSIYKEYFCSTGGLILWIMAATFFAGTMISSVLRAWWVSRWTRASEKHSQAVPYALYQQRYTEHYGGYSLKIDKVDPIWFYLAVYVGLSISEIVIGTIKSIWASAASIKTSQVLFDNVIHKVLGAPMRWLDTVPNGRIMNRFTADFSVLDSRIHSDLTDFMYSLMELVGISIAGFLVSPIMIAFAVVSVSIAILIGQRYLKGAREVKRLESLAISPILELFDVVGTGLSTIRAFGKAEAYIDRMQAKIDTHTTALMHLWLFNQWMALRLNLLAAFFVVILASLIVCTRGIDASLAGFALAFALRYNDAIIWAVRSYASLEMDMNSTERIVEYSRLKTEDPSGAEPPVTWPSQGRIEINSFVAGYAVDLPPVLKGLSFTAEPNQKVGIVGRTGAGKSSLTLALFRFLEARQGSIVIDGIDISKISLPHLRRGLAIIPQDPVLFSGTVRTNLDPDGKHTDADLRAALQKVNLICISENGTGKAAASTSAVSSATNTNSLSLSTTISPSGHNLSQGQRQLLCLARALLSSPKILILDEATSAVDKATDVLIHDAVYEHFRDSTVLVIAHRLSTVVHCDCIVVMSDGRAVEVGTPVELYARRGVFREMVRQCGEDLGRGLERGRGKGREVEMG